MCAESSCFQDMNRIKHSESGNIRPGSLSLSRHVCFCYSCDSRSDDRVVQGLVMLLDSFHCSESSDRLRYSADARICRLSLFNSVNT